MPTNKLYANYFFIEIDLDRLEHAKNWAQFPKIEGFQNKNNQKVDVLIPVSKELPPSLLSLYPNSV